MYKITKNDFLGKISKSYKTLLLCCLSVITFGLSTQFFYAQDVGSSSVQANFGIDGDVYANRLQFLNIEMPPVPYTVPPIGTDDWFKSEMWPGAGLGVIDQATPPHNPDSDPLPGGIIPALNNTPFERHQSIIPSDLGVNPAVVGVIANFPVVLEGVTPYLWLDAVYGRDTYVDGGSAETSYFAGSGDKNPDNPNTWSIGTAGSVPQKDDIIDVYAHLRGEGPRVPPNMLPEGDPNYDANDDRPFTRLWAFAGGSLVVTNGNKHLDFEFFRTDAQLVGGAIINTGGEGGRTAWTFDPNGPDDAPNGGDDGSILIPGTIIVSVDYVNGGNVPDIRIRVWMSETTFNNYDNTWDGRPFNVDKTVAFEKGTDSGDYGYAAINPKAGGLNMWGRVNDDKLSDAGSTTLGPPWGTWQGVKPTAVNSYERYQFVEIGIDLTAFGLDRRGSEDPCANILGSLLVKTRSSGGGPNDETAFGSELKDFAGPYRFGYTVPPPMPEVTDLEACEEGNSGMATFTLDNGVTNNGGGIISFHTSQTDAEFGANPIADVDGVTPGTQYTTGSTTIYVRSVLPQSNCATVVSFDIVVNESPTAEAGDDDAVCYDDGVNTMQLDGSASGGTSPYSYAWSGDTTYLSATNIANPTHDNAPAGTYNLTLTVTDDNGCEDTDTVQLVVYPNPTAEAGDDDAVCYDDGVNTMQLDGSASGGTSPYSYAWSGDTTYLSATNIANPTHDNAPAGTYNLTLTVTDDNGC
ncbi:PKD domain-containing protein, partial [Aestuariibaculum lutulentum]